MVKRSAGVLVYRKRQDRLEVLLVHPGGPFWSRKDAGVWSIPKGEYDDGEEAEAAARREFTEETGWRLDAVLAPLGEVRQKAGKLVTAFAVGGDFDPETLRSNDFEMEWPPRSGQTASFPEVDRAEWLTLEQAREKMLPAQLPLLDSLAQLLDDRDTG